MDQYIFLLFYFDKLRKFQVLQKHPIRLLWYHLDLIKFLFLFLILFSFNSLNANEDKLKTEITKNLRCLVCQGQSVYDSDSEFAVSLKLVVENKIQQGLTEDQIYKFLTDKYGEWILYDPKFNKNTYLLWFLPLLILLLGGAIIVKKLIKN